MNTHFNLLLVSLLVVSIQCDSLFLNENDRSDITAVIEQDELVIRNSLEFDVYYFAVAQSSLPYITWEPRVDENNKVAKDDYKVVKVNDLFAYENGEPVVFFYWDENITEVFSILIE